MKNKGNGKLGGGGGASGASGCASGVYVRSPVIQSGRPYETRA